MKTKAKPGGKVFGWEEKASSLRKQKRFFRGKIIGCVKDVEEEKGEEGWRESGEIEPLDGRKVGNGKELCGM